MHAFEKQKSYYSFELCTIRNMLKVGSLLNKGLQRKLTFHSTSVVFNMLTLSCCFPRLHLRRINLKVLVSTGKQADHFDIMSKVELCDNL